MTRWALVGASDVAATRMIPAIRAHQGTVGSVYSSVLPHAEQFAAAHQIPRATNDLTELFDGADAAYISTQNPKHAEHTAAALAAGLHVLVEKPMTLDLEQGLDLVTLAQQHRRVLGVNHHLPNSAVVGTLAQLVADQVIGEVLAIRVNHAVHLPERLRTWRIADLPGAGVIFDVTVHDASVVALILDRPPTSVVAQAVRQGPWPKGAHDAVMSSWRWDDEVCCQTFDAFTIGYNITSIDIFGTAGTLNATDVMTQEPLGQITVTDTCGTRSIDIPNREDLYQVSVRNFTNALQGVGEPTVTGLAGIQATAIALAVDQAARTGMSTEVFDARAQLAART